MSHDISSAQFWNETYLKGEAGWDKGVCAPPILRMLNEPVVPPTSRIAVIGAGKGHEALAAARAAHRVTAVDFAEEACVAIAANAKAAGLTLEVLEEDIFLLPKRRPGHYDAVLEHTCFCAIAVERRSEYVEGMHALLKKGGTLFGLFYAHGKPGGPPFDTNAEEVRRLFSARFTINRLLPAKDSFDHRAGKELEAVFTAI
jgi:SAM-dependent methyltransferase